MPCIYRGEMGEGCDPVLGLFGVLALWANKRS